MLEFSLWRTTAYDPKRPFAILWFCQQMKNTYTGSCHCGHARFEVDADIDHVRICDCSICRKRGALIHRVPESDVRIQTSLDDLTCYQWGTFTGKDFFCPTCGVLPFRRPSRPSAEEASQGFEVYSGWAINTNCLTDFDPSTVPHEKVNGSNIRIPD